MKHAILLAVAVLIGGMGIPATVFAQEPCGSIIEYYDYGDGPVIDSETPIEDCDNPFGIAEVDPALVVTYGDTALEHGSTYAFLTGNAYPWNITGYTSEYAEGMLYLHSGSDYILKQYIPNGESYRFTEAGTYTFVVSEMYSPVMTRGSALERFRELLIPTAFASYIGPALAVTFTVTEPVEEPAGASSVLFIPGIMGSRLYEMSDVCDSEVDEQERWVSMSECDQMQMAMRIDGVSENEIYTKTGEAGLVEDVFAAFNLYETFVDALEDWKGNELIADYAVLPYDWRLGLDSILKTKKNSEGHVVYDITTPYNESYMYQTVKDLAENQDGGKVTIVTHSNGGLLAKAFLHTLDVNNDPLLLSIDTVVMVAAPQVGTPDALMGMLHGTEILPIISQETTRQLMANMPFAYHLLPNANYFSGSGSGVQTPVITFEDGAATNPWVSMYGTEIADADTMQSFMHKESGRAVPDVNDLLTPAVVDGYLFGYANTIETLLGEWEVPSHIKLYQIAGTGIDTPAGITYFTDRECVSRNPLKLFQCTEYKAKLGYRPNMVIDGDGTVVVPSALAMSTSTENVERRWVNLSRYNENNLDRVHKDIFEVNDVIDFVQNTIQASSTIPYEYFSDTPPQLPEDDRLVLYLHSPLDMSVTTQDGVVSSTTNTIRGATYRRYGELQYISFPRDTDETPTLVLNGLLDGSFTLEIEEWESNKMEERHTYAGIPSSTSTRVQMEIQDTTPIANAVLEVDYNGDGTGDIAYNTSGEIAASVTYDTLKNAISTLSLKLALKKVLLATAKVAEHHHQKSLTKPKYAKIELRILHTLKQQVVLYMRLRFLSQTEGQSIIGIIESLIKK